MITKTNNQKIEVLLLKLQTLNTKLDILESNFDLYDYKLALSLSNKIRRLEIKLSNLGIL